MLHGSSTGMLWDALGLSGREEAAGASVHVL